MSDLGEFLHARLDEREAVSRAATQGTWVTQYLRRHDQFAVVSAAGPLICNPSGQHREADARYMAVHDPQWVLADVKGKRLILAEVESWKHDYNEGDPWYSCALAADDWSGGEPGSGCIDDERRATGRCDCGLDRRRQVILGALVLAYAGHPDYRPEWAPEQALTVPSMPDSQS